MTTPPLIKIAVADDHTVMRKGVIELINSFGEFKVIMDAVNGKELVEKMVSASTLPDICILDINMPVQNGYETAAQIKQRWPEIKILALSMLSEEFSVIRMLRNGASGYILKDCDPMELRRALLGVHNHSFYHSELLTNRLIMNLHKKDNRSANLTDKETEFLSYCCKDLTYTKIAERMNVSPRTIEDYRDALFNKLNIKSRIALAIFSLRMGLCSPE